MIRLAEIVLASAAIWVGRSYPQKSPYFRELCFQPRLRRQCLTKKPLEEGDLPRALFVCWVCVGTDGHDAISSSASEPANRRISSNASSDTEHGSHTPACRSRHTSNRSHNPFSFTVSTR